MRQKRRRSILHHRRQEKIGRSREILAGVEQKNGFFVGKKTGGWAFAEEESGFSPIGKNLKTF